MSTNTKSTDEIVDYLFARPTLPPLEPGKTFYDPQISKNIADLKNENKYVKAALYLANDDIEGAHTIAADNEGDPTANLLHATLHRREGDYWNSKYWWSRVGKHPLMPSSAAAKSFVDNCEAVKGSSKAAKAAEEEDLRAKQWDQLKDLVRWTRENSQ